MNAIADAPLNLYIALAGYGEVGKIFASELIARGARISFFDILLSSAEASAEKAKFGVVEMALNQGGRRRGVPSRY